MMRFKLTREARSDLKAIADYLAAEASVERSVRIIGELRDEPCRVGFAHRWA